MPDADYAEVLQDEGQVVPWLRRHSKQAARTCAGAACDTAGVITIRIRKIHNHNHNNHKNNNHKGHSNKKSSDHERKKVVAFLI